MFHLTARVAWHDSQWDGRICQAPSCNSFCTNLDRIRLEKDDDKEDKLGPKPWNELRPEDLPPCSAESGAFMNRVEWTRRFVHPYANIPQNNDTHGHLAPTLVKVPPFSTFAVPFAWMLKSEQNDIDNKLPTPLPPDENPPIRSAWVFGRERQDAILNLFSSRLSPNKSLVFFYCKEGQPLGDTISRLVVGVGHITRLAKPNAYEIHDKTKPTYLMWDLPFSHSIRPDGHKGFILPYHEYLEPTGDLEEDSRRKKLLYEIAVQADPTHIRLFSYAAELAPADIALSTLVQCLAAVQKIKEHGIAEGPWERREEWLNKQISLVWKDRGAFPGLGPCLEALGMRLGTALTLELSSSGMVELGDDPWPVVNSIIRGERSPPSEFASEIETVRDTWINLPEERRALLKLMSRFALTSEQAIRWFDCSRRAKGITEMVTDRQILENAYRMSEVDLGTRTDSPISVGIIDRGLLPDSTIAAKHPVPALSSVGSPNDARRRRAAVVTVLREASINGDSLLSTSETLQRAANLDLAHPCDIQSDWPSTNPSALDGVVEHVDISSGDTDIQSMSALQLTDVKERESWLRRILSGRANKPIAKVNSPWKQLIERAITMAGEEYDSSNERHVLASLEQANALDRITSRRLSVLVGRAGTGKTAVMGALTLSEPLMNDGILLLAPTGKARVQLSNATKTEAMTVAQFLYRLGRYDGMRQRPLLKGNKIHRKEKTVVIDESSMLTMDDMVAILKALDLAHVHRVIFVGDPNQLPPIGIGRPFADLVSYLETTSDDAQDGTPVGNALARLTVEVRKGNKAGDSSDALRLASWFTREPQPVDADRVLSDLELGEEFNDLDIEFWKTPDELRFKLSKVFQRYLQLSNSDDIVGFNTSLGIDNGWIPFDQPSGSELWQILSPVRMHPHGVHHLNRWVQMKFRGAETRHAAHSWGISLGDEKIVKRDKVIQTYNEQRDAYNGHTTTKHYLANGEVGLVAPGKNGWLNVLFAGRPNLRFGYRNSNFRGGSGPLELAYALTIHKSQGSQFRKVFVVLPEESRILTRELIYTALTRSRDQLVLLIEGDNASALFDLSQPERSETARRNTNLFKSVVRASENKIPYAEHLIHTTEKGHLVRSKSELVIANMLYREGIDYQYERVYEGTVEPGYMRPDFSFVKLDGDLVIWEHLGMLDREDYKRGWEWKRDWYLANGFTENETLFTTTESAKHGLDSTKLKDIANTIKEQID